MNIQHAWNSFYTGNHENTRQILKSFGDIHPLEAELIQTLMIFSTQSLYQAILKCENVLEKAKNTKSYKTAFKAGVIFSYFYYMRFRFNKALSIIEEVEPFLLMIPNENLEIQNWMSIMLAIKGSCFYARHQKSKGLKFLDEGIKLSLKGGNNWILGLVFRTYGAAHNQKSESEKAIIRLQESQQYFLKAHNNTWYGFGLCQEGAACNQLGDINQALTLSQKAMKFAEDKQDAFLIPYTANCIWSHYQKNNNITEAIEFFTKKLEQYKANDFFWGAASMYIRLASIYQFNGDLDASLNFLQENAKLIKRIGHPLDEASTFILIGDLYSQRGDFQQAIELYNLSLAKQQDFRKTELYGNALFFLGTTYMKQGDTDQADKIFAESLPYLEDLGDDNSLGIIYTKIGDIYQIRGNLDSALSNYQKCIKISEAGYVGTLPAVGWHEIPYSWYEATINIGRIYKLKGDFIKAKNTYESCLDVSKRLYNPHHVDRSNVLYQLCILFLEMNDDKALVQYQEKLDELYKTHPLAIVELRKQIIEGLKLKQSPRMSNKVRSMDIFRKIANAPVIQLELTMFGIMNLYELLLAELKSFGEQEALHEIRELSKIIESVSNKLHSPHLQIEYLILDSKLSLIEFNLEKSIKSLEQAEALIAEHKASHLSQKIQYEKEKLNNELKKWKALVDQNVSVFQRVKQSEMVEYISKLKKILPDLLLEE